MADGHPEWARSVSLEAGMPVALRDGVWMGETAFLDGKGREANPPGLFYFFRATFRFFVTPAAFTALRYSFPRTASISARRS